MATGDALAAALERMYRHLGRRYLDLSLLLGYVAIFVLVVAFSALIAIDFRTTFSGFLHILVVVEVPVALAGFVWVPLYRHRLRRVWRVAGSATAEPETLQAAWEQGVARLPQSVVLTGVVIALAVVPSELHLARYLLPETPLVRSAPMVIAFGTALIVCAAGTVYVIAEFLTRPVFRDVGARISGRSDRTFAGVSVASKLAWLPSLLIMLTAIVMSALVVDARPAARIATALVVAVAITVLTLPLTFLFRRSITSPVQELIAAAERVGAGDLDVVVPILGDDEFGLLAHTFNQMTRGLVEREALNAAFGSYVDPSVARRVLATGALVEGEEVDASVMFLDIRGFTQLSELAAPRDVVRTLNRYCEAVVPVIQRHGGHANKFLGDGLLAAFGALEPHEDHARRALDAAADIVAVVQDTFGGTIDIGIGVNSGRFVVGTVGGGGKLDFTLIGDTVNVAARVQDLTKETGDRVLVTEATAAALGATMPCTSRGSMHVRGRSEPVEVYAVDVTAGTWAQT